MVRTAGFEPAHLVALPPQDSVSTVPPRSQNEIITQRKNKCKQKLKFLFLARFKINCVTIIVNNFASKKNI